MLEGVLYTVVSRGQNKATVRLIPENPIYKAHFPDYPITPGVTLLQIALELIDKKLIGAKEIKFVAPVLPGDGTEISYEWEFKDESSVSVILLAQDGTQYARMSLSV